jgi:signal transduction histidine kinase
MDDPGAQREASAGLVALLDLIERPAVALDLHGSILGANARFLDFARGRGAVVLGRISALLAPAGDEIVREALQSGAATPPELVVEFRDGQRRGARLERVSRPGQTPFAVLVVDERRHPGDPARQLARARLRHDLAGPLTAILGTAELLLIRRSRDLPGDVRQSLDEILQHCGRMSQILARVRSTGGPESGE